MKARKDVSEGKNGKGFPAWSVALKSWREKKGMTQEQAATALGVNVRSLQFWEQGRKPSDSLWAVLSARLKETKKIVDKKARHTLSV